MVFIMIIEQNGHWQLHQEETLYCETRHYSLRHYTITVVFLKWDTTEDVPWRSRRLVTRHLTSAPRHSKQMSRVPLNLWPLLHHHHHHHHPVPKSSIVSMETRRGGGHLPPYEICLWIIVFFLFHWFSLFTASAGLHLFIMTLQRDLS